MFGRKSLKGGEISLEFRGCQEGFVFLAGLSWERSPQGEPLDLCFRHISDSALPLQCLSSQAWAFGVTARMEMQTYLHPEL